MRWPRRWDTPMPRRCGPCCGASSISACGKSGPHTRRAGAIRSTDRQTRLLPVGPEPLVRRAEPFGQFDLVAPAQRVEAADVEELSRRAIGLGGVELDRDARRDDVADPFRELANREVLAGADVDVLVAVVVLHHV